MSTTIGTVKCEPGQHYVYPSQIRRHGDTYACVDCAVALELDAIDKERRRPVVRASLNLNRDELRFVIDALMCRRSDSRSVTESEQCDKLAQKCRDALRSMLPL